MPAYATLTDYATYGLSAAGFDDASITAALAAASADADASLAAVFELPLTSWPVSLTEKVCQIATYRLLSRKGFNPERDSDRAIRMDMEDAVRWLERIAAGSGTLVGAVDSSPPPQQPEGGFSVITNPSRGWGDCGVL